VSGVDVDVLPSHSTIQVHTGDAEILGHLGGEEGGGRRSGNGRRGPEEVPSSF